MKKLICYFSGWFEIDVKNVDLTNPETEEIKTAYEWLNKRGNIDGLILESFSNAYADSLDGEFEQLDLSIKET